MKCYHHNDLDGRCAGAIVYQEYPNCEMIEVDYKDAIDIEAIGPQERIFIVDFSFKPEVMKKVLERTRNVTWIDHHKTAMEYNYEVDLAGIRTTKYSGCELTWQCLRPLGQKVPEAVLLIGDYDTWTFRYKHKTRLFHTGLGIHNTNPKDSIWLSLLEREDRIQSIIAEGKICDRYLNQFTAGYRSSFGYETDFHGHRCYAMNLYKLGSPAFGKRFKEYAICISFAFDGEQWTVGLYSDKVDVGHLAKQHGGGGHTGAAGFVCITLPFSKGGT